MFGAPSTSDIRPVAREDLLADAADTDPGAVARYITGRHRAGRSAPTLATSVCLLPDH